MDIHRLENMIRGWFVGNFEPTLYRTEDVEVGVKQYEAGTVDEAHYHKIATEITVIIEGRAEMNGRALGPGDIVVVKPGEVADFSTLTRTTTVVVKLPGATSDKYLANND